MAWSYRHYPLLDLLVTHGSGVLSDRDYTVGVKALRQDATAIAATRRVSDYTQVDRFEITEASLKALQRPQPLPGRHAILIFSPSGESVFERHLRKILAGNVKLFISRQEAVDWLNEGVSPGRMISFADTLPPADLPPLRT